MKVPCDHCGKILDRPPSRVKANGHQFCDRACFSAFNVRRIDVQCSICEHPMQVHPSKYQKNNHFACSPACKAELSRRARISYFGSADERYTACDYCGQQIERKPSQIAKYKHNFCNRECKKAWQTGQTKPQQVTGDWYPCNACGKSVWRTPATLMDRVFCSPECAQKVIPAPDRTGHPGPRGPDCPAWRGGKSLESYTVGFTRMVSRQVRERDNHRCRMCNTQARRPGDLVAHHIDFAKDNHDLSNLITLCRTCHGKVHAKTIDLSELTAVTL